MSDETRRRLEALRKNARLMRAWNGLEYMAVPWELVEVAMLAALPAAPPPDPYAVLARDIVRQVQQHYRGLPLPTKGSTTVYADAQMVQDAIKEGEKAPPEDTEAPRHD